MTKPPLKLIFVTGSGHSGSTLLDMSLTATNGIVGLGEVGDLQLELGFPEVAQGCTCRKSVEDCPFWQKVDGSLRDLHNRDLADLKLLSPDAIRHRQDGTYQRPAGQKSIVSLAKALGVLQARFGRFRREPSGTVGKQFRAIVDDRIALYDAVRDASNADILVDSTKNPGFLTWLANDPRIEVTIIHLVRDGRAVCLSRMRREKKTFATSLLIWMIEQAKVGVAIKFLIPSKSVIKIRYEDLARDPDGVIASATSSTFGSKFSDAEIGDFSHERHNLGGNPIRHKHVESVSTDDRWRKEIRTVHNVAFQLVGGVLNRSRGYSWSANQ